MNVLNSMGELHECVGDYICPAYALSDKKRFCSMIKKITDEYLDYCDNRGIIIGLDNKPKSLDYFYNYLRNFNWERLNQSEISYLLFVLNKFSTDTLTFVKDFEVQNGKLPQTGSAFGSEMILGFGGLLTASGVLLRKKRK